MLNPWWDSFLVSMILLAVHLIPFGIANYIWTRKPVERKFTTYLLDFLGLGGAIISLIIFLIFALDQHPPSAQGNAASWFIIYSVVTLGITPALTLLSFFFAGRLTGRIRFWRRNR